MKPFESYRQETEISIKGMLHDGKFSLNPLADPQRHGESESEYGAEGPEYRAKALQALAIVQSANAGPEQWREAAELLRQCAQHAINARRTAATEIGKAVCLASEGTAAAAGIAARYAAAWLEGFHAQPPPHQTGRPDALETRILLWLNRGRTGLSSETIAYATVGLEAQPHWHPTDASSFNLCLLLRAAIPETEAGLNRLSETCPHCRAIRDQWPRLEEACRQYLAANSRLTQAILAEIEQSCRNLQRTSPPA